MEDNNVKAIENAKNKLTYWELQKEKVNSEIEKLIIEKEIIFWEGELKYWEK